MKKRNPKKFQPESLLISDMGHKDKDKSEEEATGEVAGSAHDARQATQDLSRERAAAVEKMFVDAVARWTAELTATLMAILNERVTLSMLTALKVTSGAAGISVRLPLTGLGTRLSTSDGNCGLKRLDTPLMQWRETQKRPRFHISTI